MLPSPTLPALQTRLRQAICKVSEFPEEMPQRTTVAIEGRDKIESGGGMVPG